MKSFWKIVQYLLALFMIYGGIKHFTSLLFYIPFVPHFLSYKIFIIYITGGLEIFLGVLLLNTKYAKNAALGIFILMLIYLPIHIWDVFSDTPAIGTHKAALIRLPFQFLFIAWAYKIKQLNSK